MREINSYKIVIDFVVFLLLFILLVVQHYFIKIPQASIRCDDYSISHEYRKSKVSNLTLQIVTSLVPIGIMITIELTQKRQEAKESNKNKKTQAEGTCMLISNNRSIYYYVNVGSFIFGYLLVCFITEFGKYNVGSLRPHYLDVCKPYYFNEKKSRDCSIKEIYYYGKDFNCTNNDEKIVREAQLSFPSGHASLSFYSMIFLILYVQLKWNLRKELILIKYCIQFSMFLCACYISITRITDNYHCFTDVFIGSSIGITCALIVIYKLVKFSKEISTSTNDTIQLEIV